MRRLLLSLMCAGVGVALALVVPAAADAAYRAPCTPGSPGGPGCTWWSGKVTFIDDGDTVVARIRGVGTRRVRFSGINAMELHRYSRHAALRRGDCHGVEATATAERAIRASRYRIRLAAQDPASHSGARLRRTVWVKAGGRWQDLSAMQLRAGQALWLPNGTEHAHDAEYARLAAQAIAARRNLYDPTYCGTGPDQDLPVSLGVKWDADGTDGLDINGEWADVRNGGDRPLSLAGWHFRDSGPTSYAFPATATVPAHGALRLYMGCGPDSAGALHWCQQHQVFGNGGDGAYLYDPQGDVRSAFEYPCQISCADPLAGVLQVSAHPRDPESISVTNVGAATVDLGDHVLGLRIHGSERRYRFGEVFRPGTVLAPGAALTIDPDSYGPGYPLSDRGGVVDLRTLTDVPTACFAWGFGRC